MTESKRKRTDEALKWMASGGRMFVNIMFKLIQAFAKKGVTDDQIHALERKGGKQIIEQMAEVVLRGGADTWQVTHRITRLVATFVAMTKLEHEYDLLMGRMNDQRDVVFIRDEGHDVAKLVKDKVALGYEPVALVPFLRWWYAKGMVEHQESGVVVCIIGSPVQALPPMCEERSLHYPLFYSHAQSVSDVSIAILDGESIKGHHPTHSYAFVKMATE